jgi:hypothetical protein
MQHIDHAADDTLRSGVSSEWLKVAMSVSDLANQWACRNDVIAIVGPSAGRGGPACFLPTLAELEINSGLAFGPLSSPEAVGDLTKEKQQYEFPRAVGLIAHEAFHARYSSWDHAEVAKDLSSEEMSAFEELEESRIEYHGILDEPRTKNFLRSTVIDLNLEGIGEASDTATAFATFSLIQARVQGGTLNAADVSEVMSHVNTFLGADTVMHLSGIVSRFHESRDVAERMDLAREWAGAKNTSATEHGEEKLPPNLAEMLQDALEGAMLSATMDLADQEAMEEQAARVSEKQERTKERKKNESAALRIFGKNSVLSDGKTSSEIVNVRPADSSERIAAVLIAKELERAKYHDRVEFETTNYLPPGRLKTRSIIQARAAESKGLRPKLEPWRRTVRKHVIDPTLTVAVMVDISGSMRRAMGPMATTAWVMSEAVRRVQGRVAMAYFGDSVFATLRPGEHLSQVVTYGANDGTEEFDQAFRSLDGALSLLGGSGARLLVIASDGHYRFDQLERAKYWLTRCAEAGVAVLWLPYDTGNSVSRILRSIPSKHISVVTGTLAPAEAATKIGKAAALALSYAGR